MQNPLTRSLGLAREYTKIADSAHALERIEIVISIIFFLLFLPSIKVGPKPVNGSVQCLCTHLSAFGGDFLVAPNPIDFDQVWDAFSNILETKNFVVLGTVCAMLGIYLIVVVLARRADQSDRQKVRKRR